MPSLIRMRDVKVKKKNRETRVEMLKPSEYLSRYKQPIRPPSPSVMSVTSADFFQDAVENSTPVESENEDESGDEEDSVNTLVLNSLTEKTSLQSEIQTKPHKIWLNPFLKSSSNPFCVQESMSHPYELLNEDDANESNEETQKQFDALEQMSEISLNLSSDDSGELSCDFNSSANTITENDDTCEPEHVKEEEIDPDSPKAFIKSLAVDDRFFFINHPDIIRDPGIQLDFQKIPEGEIDIHISEVYSPIHFYFHHKNEVGSMKALLQEDYSGIRPEQFIISDENMKKNLLVVCYLENFEEWHRAIIINPPDSKNRVRLNFVDYGTVGLISKTCIKFLFEKYSHYPRMANRGRFLNLKPPNQEKMWNDKPVNKFLTKISNKALKAEVRSHDLVDNVYVLDITYKGKNLREWIVEQHVADSFEVLQPNAIYPFCYYFPTFDALEKEYPCFHEKSLLLFNEIDFDFLLETNFLSAMKPEVVLRSPKILRLLGKSEFNVIRRLILGKTKFLSNNQ